MSPYLLLGLRGASFLRTTRPVTFYLSYPMALSVLAAWLLVWGVGNLDTLLDRRRQGGVQ